MPSPQQTQLLRQASDKAKSLLQGLQRDQVAVAGIKEGHSAFTAAVDDARTTMDNLNRTLEEASVIKSD